VLISVISQGWSLPLVARRLRIGRPADPTPALTMEINALRQVDGEIVDYTVKPGAQVAGRQLRHLALPDGVLVTLILRGKEVLMPRGSSSLQPGDHVFVALRTHLEPLIDRLFAPEPEPAVLPPDLTLSFSAATTLEQLHRFLGHPLPGGIGPETAGRSLGQLLAEGGAERTVRAGALTLRPGPDDDHVAVRGGPLRR